MGKRKWITKAEVREILKTYSIRKDEFVEIDKIEYYYKSKFAKGYVIAIKPEEIKGKDIVEQTKRILVQHCKSNGEITHTDFWERNKEEKLQFLFRQDKAELPDSAAYVNDLREEIKRLQRKNKNLLQQFSDTSTNKVKETDTAELEKLLTVALKERSKYEQLYQKLKNEINTRKKAGRKKREDSEKSKKLLEEVHFILENEPNNKEPWISLGISRASFFRYKKLISEANK